MKNFLQADPARIDDNFIRSIGQGWMLITAGDAARCNTMTASWGFAGEIWGRPAAAIVVRPQRYTFGFVEENERLSLSFFSEEHREALRYCGSHSGRDSNKFAATGLTPVYTDDGVPAVGEARLVLQCRKLYADDIRPEKFLDPACDGQWYPNKDYHRMYILEIERAYVKA